MMHVLETINIIIGRASGLPCPLLSLSDWWRALTRHNTALLLDHLWFLLMLFPKRLIELFSIFVFSILQDSHFWQNKSKIDKSTTTVTKFKKRLKIQLSFRPKSSVYLPRVIYYVENQPTMAKNSWIHRHLHTDQN